LNLYMSTDNCGGCWRMRSRRQCVNALLYAVYALLLVYPYFYKKTRINSECSSGIQYTMISTLIQIISMDRDGIHAYDRVFNDILTTNNKIMSHARRLW